VGRALVDLAVGHDRALEPAEPGAAGADDELPDPGRRIRDAGRGLGREALVVVIVAGNRDLCAGGIEVLPQREREVVGAGPTGAEPGVMPERDRARRAARREVRLEPLLL